MSERRIPIERLPTGVPGLDEVLGGGLPAYSFNLVAGDPGSGKTTLSTQVMFANATAERPALHFTVLGEPPVKMLRYQQQFDFFDLGRVGNEVRYLNLSDEAIEGDLAAVLERIGAEVERHQPGIVVVDSFRTVVRSLGGRGAEAELQDFIQRLALHLANWEVTSFLVGEYERSESGFNPVFTVADGLLWLTQAVDRNSVVRKLHVLKMRGQGAMPGLHTFRISREGVRVFPRMGRMRERRPPEREPAQLSTGVPGLDAMMGGGVPEGHALLVAGATGTGKSILARQFVAAASERGDPAVLAVFEEHVGEYMARSRSLGVDLEALAARDMVEIIYLRPVDLSVDEVLHAIQEAVARLGAKRVVIDSISGFEIALAPTFRDEFRESLYRLVGELTGTGVTVLMTVEVAETFGRSGTSGHAVSFLADDIVLLRYAEIDGALQPVLLVLKMRGGSHSREFRAYQITPEGIVIGDALSGFEGILTGTPTRRGG